MHDDGMEWRCLNCLHDLCFRGIPKLKFLPVGPQCVSTLKRLTIENCPNLMTLPELTSLEYLDIEGCDPNLTSLETLSCLTSLRWLWLGIEDFPNLITLPDSIRISNLTWNAFHLELSQSHNTTWWCFSQVFTQSGNLFLSSVS